jgi:segregation and condensation protein B
MSGTEETKEEGLSGPGPEESEEREASPPEPKAVLEGASEFAPGSSPETAPDITAPLAAEEPGGVAPEPLRLLEAALFAAAEPLSERTLAELLPEADVAALLAELATRYAGRGVELVNVAGGWQFRTAPDLAPHLRKVVIEARKLSRAALETLAIIAYHQPITRAEIEAIRGVSLAQATLEALLEAGLIAPRGRKETPGRPVLWGTTELFLRRFGLRALSDLPKREELLLDAQATLFPETGETPSVPSSSAPPAAPVRPEAAEVEMEGEGAEGEEALGEETEGG